MNIIAADKSEWVPTQCTAFAGSTKIATGELREVVTQAKRAFDASSDEPIVIWDDTAGRLLEIDYRGSTADVLERLAYHLGVGQPVPQVDQEQRPGPGRPKLGVIAREVTLLPRHWDWLTSQPGGASVTLRKLVEEARRANSAKDQIRKSQEVSYRFITDMAGDRPGYEEVIRGLYAGNTARFNELVEQWPEDIRDHAKSLAAPALLAE